MSLHKRRRLTTVWLHNKKTFDKKCFSRVKMNPIQSTYYLMLEDDKSCILQAERMHVPSVPSEVRQLAQTELQN